MPESPKIRSRIEYAALNLLAWLFRTLPLWASRKLADIVAFIASNVIRFRKTVAVNNLQAAFPDMRLRESRGIYHSCWRHFMRLGAEMSRLPYMGDRFVRKWIDFTDKAVLDQILELGKGIIVVSGHFGNWEWMGGSISKAGYPISYVVTSQTNPLVEQWLNRMRISAGIEIIHRRDAVRGVLRALKSNRIVAILSDQDAGNAGVFVPYFNRLASTPRGPAVFHLKTGAPIVFGSAVRDSKGRFKTHFEPMVFKNLTGDRNHDEKLIMCQITAKLEEKVRQNPDQWLWLHRRWKTRPLQSA